MINIWKISKLEFNFYIIKASQEIWYSLCLYGEEII